MASRFAMNGIQKLTRNRRVARAAAKRAAAAGVPITAKSLRVWLSRADTAQQLRQCTEHSLDEAARQLTYVIPGREAGQRQVGALLVLQIVMEEYVRSAVPSEASLVTGDWGRQTTREDGAKTREQVQELRENVLGRMDVRTDFDDALRTLSPWSAQEARRLRPAWPAVERAAGILAGVEAARGSVIQQWVDQEPTWLEGAPAEALGWLGQLAADYDAQGASRLFFERCAREGGYPRDFFVARAALQAGSRTDEGVRDYLAAHHDATSSLLNALWACVDEDWAEGIEQLGRWEPHNELALAMKVQLEAQALIKMGRSAEALAQLRAADREGKFTGVAVSLASALLQHAVQSRTSNRLAAGQEALAVAVRARNSRRIWYGDSTEAALLAVQAAVLSGDLSRAWKLTQPEPDGEAQPHEAADHRMREQTALVTAMTGRQQEAEQLLAGMTNAFGRAHVRAVLAESLLADDTSTSEVKGLWLQAWEAADTEGEQLTAAAGLAAAGADLPELDHLKADFSDLVAEIELLARALRGSGGDELAVLRANVAQSPVIVVKLAERYHRGGNLVLAAETLKDGADHWRDARLMAMAAGLFQEAREYSRARECADAALRTAGDGWAGQGRMYALLVEVESADGRMDRATDAAIRLLALDPLDPEARWALVKCYAARALGEQAWQILTEQGEPLDPRSRDEALLWVGLGASFSADPQFTGRALALMQRWPEDEELLGRLLGALHWRAAEPAEPLSEEEGEQLREATASYLERFPDSTVFRAVSLGTPENPLENLAEELRLHHENNREIREKVTSGELPVGMLALAAGRSYAEACMRRTAERPVAYAADIPLDPAETLAVQTARNGRVMLDTSAAATLALLEGGVSEQLIGHSQVVMTTDQLLADALQAKESIALRSDMTLAWDERSANAAVLTSTPEQLAALRSTAARLVEIMQSAPRVSRPELRSLPRLPSGRRGTAWLTAVDYAKEHGHILWCDDRVLRAVARSQGVAAFGTLALIDACMQGNLMAPREGLVIKAELLRNYYVDIPFSADLYGAAARADSWQAKAVAVAVSRPGAWSDAQAAAAFALHAASQIIGSLPHEASSWLSAAYAGLYRATLPSHRPRNLQVFSWQVLTQPWISASSLPFVLAGLHAGREDVADTEAALQAALTQYYGALIDQVGHIAAASTLMSLFALTDEKDKATAARTVLTHRAR
ncbi:tetratricopeptide repeat protein [Streptomyces sp. NPDC057950]|uniref:tetratricopeptide repeat protein n=1 Tax=Streptomyces sp. NPDC057950 TaxID=3346288 RepID=UPI0036ECBE91